MNVYVDILQVYILESLVSVVMYHLQVFNLMDVSWHVAALELLYHIFSHHDCQCIMQISVGYGLIYFYPCAPFEWAQKNVVWNSFGVRIAVNVI